MNNDRAARGNKNNASSLRLPKRSETRLKNNAPGIEAKAIKDEM